MSVQVQYEDGTSTFINLQSRSFEDFTTSVSNMDVFQLWYCDCRGEKVVLENDEDFSIFLGNESPKTIVYIAQLQNRKRLKRCHHFGLDESLAMAPIGQKRPRKSSSPNNSCPVPTKTIGLVIDSYTQSDQTVLLNPFQKGNFEKLNNVLKESLGNQSLKLYYIDKGEDHKSIDDDDDLLSMMKEVGISLIIHVSLLPTKRTDNIDIDVLVEDQNKTKTVSINQDDLPVYNVLYDSVARLFPHLQCVIYLYYHDHDNECIILEDDNDFQNFLEEVKPPRLHVTY